MSNQLTLFYAVAKATYALRSVKRLSATFPPVSSVVAPADRHAKPLDEALIVVTKWLGVPGKLSTVTTSNSTEWFWEEKREGKYLKWLHPTRVRYY
jgi:hypothetical protein